MCHPRQSSFSNGLLLSAWTLWIFQISGLGTIGCSLGRYLTNMYKHKKRNAQIYSLTNRKVPDVHLDVQRGLSEDPGGDLWPAALTKRLWAEMEDKPQSRQLPSPKPMTLDILKPTLRIPDGNQTNRQLYSRIDRIAVSVFLFINSTKHYMQYQRQGSKLFW